MVQTKTREPGVHTVALTVNGKRFSREVEPRQLLVYFIREQLGLTGTHVGCDTSQCGACTILLNGVAVKSCTILAVQADGAEIKTIEAYADASGKPWVYGRIPSLEESIAQGAWLVGTADALGDQVSELQQELGLEYLSIFPHFPGMVREQSIEQIERFAHDIMPMLARSAEPLGVGS